MLKTALLLLVLQQTRGLPQEWGYEPRRQDPAVEKLQTVSSLYRQSGSGNDNHLEPILESWDSEKNTVQSRDSQDDPPKNDIGPAPVCKGSTFCEEVPDYPEEIVRRELQKQPGFVNYASADKVPLPETAGLVPRINVADAEPLCISIERVIYPKSAETKDKNWMYIVNQAMFTQGVRIETCVDEDGSCRVIDGFAQGYTTACKQKYIYRQLSAITGNGSITHEYFRFPASCCCHVQFTGTIARADLLSPNKVLE